MYQVYTIWWYIPYDGIYHMMVYTMAYAIWAIGKTSIEKCDLGYEQGMTYTPQLRA